MLGFPAPMNIIGSTAYLSNNKKYLMVAADDIEGGRVLTLESNSLLEQLQHITKAVKLWCGDNDIINNFTPQVLLTSF